ncbi:MAG: GHMP kinase [Pelagibacteraceae bacterium TMED124]|nr:GHMP kinase [Candidatus Neomarinimicrobiota bacterium]RPG17219.1 MAG: GHMP kinase [Pelagibacteraceae bacterium TMED124]|tara:strand:+ start:4307 stop:5296 length:990 start_codon:yes stop_codon:yes gene_type:complete
MRKNFYITSKTPLRISFFGGGTDVDYFYKRLGGKVISTAINKYVYVTVKSQNIFFEENYRLNYSKTERVDKIKNIQNKIIKECLKYTKIKSKIYISTVSDIPDSTGLGSSSAFTVGLLKALYEAKNEKKTNIELAKIASTIEIKKVKSPIGKQDQYACALGDFNIINFNTNGSVKIKKIHNRKFIKNLFSKSCLVWTGKYKKTSKILADQKKNFKTNLKNLKEILNIATRVSKKVVLRNYSINDFKLSLQKSWFLKKNLSKKILNKNINNIIKKFENNTRSAYKILGAGGGGFLFITGGDHKNIVKKNKFTILNVKSVRNGSEIIYKNY